MIADGDEHRLGIILGLSTRGLLTDSCRELPYLLKACGALAHLLIDLVGCVDDGGVVTATKTIPDLRKREIG